MKRTAVPAGVAVGGYSATSSRGFAMSIPSRTIPSAEHRRLAEAVARHHNGQVEAVRGANAAATYLAICNGDVDKALKMAKHAARIDAIQRGTRT
ncbi:MAG: hypothetical protein JO006_12325 [Paucibacter sp.]|nr:hypothetical protein [Roseateles sp.]